MIKLERIGLASVVLALVACGGEPKPAKSPEPVAAADAKSDMPDMSGGKDDAKAEKKAEKAEDKAEKKAEKAGAGGGMLTAVAMKWAPAKKGTGKVSAIEVKADGTVTVDGKTAAKIAGDQVQDATGATVVTVSVDGSLVGSAFKTGLYKFQGDDLAVESGAKVAIGDDGTVTVTKDGKDEPMGKFEGANATSKRAALVVFAMLVSPKEDTTKKAADPKGAAAAKKAEPAKPAEKAGGKK